jgi:sn-glycerol 3-phosphate transport system permease protein
LTDLPITGVGAEDLATTPVTVLQDPHSARRFGGRLKDSSLAYLFLAPALLAFAVFSYYPLWRLIWYATHRQSRFRNRPAQWVGAQQIVDTLKGDDFLSGLAHSGTFMLYTVPLGLTLGVLLAVAAHRKLRGIKIFQTVFSSTVASSVAVAAVVFFTLVNPEVGYFKDVSWLSLTQPRSALFAVSLSSVWQNLGLTFIIVLAALQAVPEELNEAALLDGFGPVRRFFRVTVPLISPALMFLAIVLVVNALQAYAQIELLTQGGPGDSTETLLYKIADPRGIRGLGVRASLSLGLFVLTAGVASVQYSLLSKRVHYGE